MAYARNLPFPTSITLRKRLISFGRYIYLTLKQDALTWPQFGASSRVQFLHHTLAPEETKWKCFVTWVWHLLRRIPA